VLYKARCWLRARNDINHHNNDPSAWLKARRRTWLGGSVGHRGLHGSPLMERVMMILIPKKGHVCYKNDVVCTASTPIVLCEAARESALRGGHMGASLAVERRSSGYA
jgi:hypothetical protein